MSGRMGGQRFAPLFPRLPNQVPGAACAAAAAGSHLQLVADILQRACTVFHGMNNVLISYGITHTDIHIEYLAN